MPITTYTFSVDAIAPMEPITVQSGCRKVTVRQNDISAATLTWNIRGPLASSTAVLVQPGQSFVFEFDKTKRSGEIIGYIETTSGSDTFAQIEEDKV